MKTYNILVLLILFSSFIALAGNVDGNGGNVFLCPNKSADKRVEFFDYAEGVERGYSYKLLSGLSEQEVIDLVMTRIQRFDKDKYNRFSSRLLNFSNESKMKEGVLRKSNDAFEVFVPMGCSFEQLVLQKIPYFPEDKRYNIRKDLWEQLPSFQKGLVKLHEVFYFDEIAQGAHDSTAIRYFLENMAADSADSMTKNDYDQLISRCHFYLRLRDRESSNISF